MLFPRRTCKRLRTVFSRVSQMGTLVRTAELVEERVGSVRREFEPKFRLKWQEARAEWLEFKSKRSGPGSARMQIRLRAFLLRTDAKLRLETSKFIDKLIVELERLKRSLPRDN